MEIEKALRNDHLLVTKVSWTFRIPTIYNFAAIHLWNLLSFKKVANFFTVSIIFYVYKQIFTAQ